MAEDNERIVVSRGELSALLANARKAAEAFELLIAKVERERDEARAELERVRKTLFEQQTREGEWHDWARRVSGKDLSYDIALQCAVINKIDALEKQLRQALESHADELAQVEREAFQRGLEQRDTVAASEAKTALDKWRKWAVEVCYVYGLSAPTEPDLARGIIANAVRCGTLPKPYTQPLTDAQVDELAQVARKAHDGLQEVLREDWRLSGEGWCVFWRNVVRTLAPRIARVQLRELGEEELTIAVAHYQLLRISGGVTSAEFDFVGFACRILELAQSEAPGGSGL